MVEAQQDDFPHEAIANTGVITDILPPYPDIAMGGYDSSFTVVWGGGKAGTDETSNIKGQKFGYGGGPLGAEYMVNPLAEGNRIYPSIDISAGGMTAVVWYYHNQGPDYWDIRMRLINPSINFDQTVNVVEKGYKPKVCIAGGEPVITWYETGWPDNIIRAARFDSTGERKGEIINVAHYTGVEGDHRLDCFGSGSFAVSWWERDKWTQEKSVWFQVYDSNDEPMFPAPSGDCAPAGSENSGVCVSAPSASRPDVLALSDGGVRIAYYDEDEGPIKISCFNEAAENAHLEFSVPTPGSAFTPAISGDIDKTLIAWVARESGEDSFRAARYDMTGDEPQPLPWEQFEGETHPTVSRFCPDPYESMTGKIRAAGPDNWGNLVLAWSVQMDPDLFPDRHDVMIRCFDENGLGFFCGVDVDGDGVLDMYDCDRLNPYLRYDLDSDGRCDGIIGGTLDDCLSACNRHKHEYHRTACEDQCENPDNCPCLRVPQCPYDDDDFSRATDIYMEYCRPYRDCINRREDDCNITHENEARECAKYFSNPGQNDGNENERGDRCESR